MTPNTKSNWEDLMFIAGLSAILALGMFVSGGPGWVGFAVIAVIAVLLIGGYAG